MVKLSLEFDDLIVHYLLGEEANNEADGNDLERCHYLTEMSTLCEA